MDDRAPDPPPIPWSLISGAGGVLILTGITWILCGLQLADQLLFHSTLIGRLPWVMAAAGLGATGVGYAVAQGRLWARNAGLGLALLFCFSGLAWILFGLYGGFFTGLSLAAMAMGALSTLLMLVVWRPVAQAARLQRENDALMGVSSPPFSYWSLAPLPILIAVLAWVLAPDQPPPLPTARADYRYAQSPLLRYLDYESRWVTLDRPRIEDFGAGIVAEVAAGMRDISGEDDLDAAERALWATNQEQQIPLLIAAALRKRDVHYQVEALLSRSFDPDLHMQDRQIHLDCDQLVAVFLHVAWWLDLDMRARPSPFHVYLSYHQPDADGVLYVETTSFEEEDPNALFIDADYYPSGRGGTMATPALVRAAGFYQPLDDQGLEDTLVGEVLRGLDKFDIPAPVEAELEARLPNTRSANNVSNLYYRYMAAATDALDKGQWDAATTAATKAVQLRASHGPLIIEREPAEQALLAQARRGMGDTVGQLAAAQTGLDWYATNYRYSPGTVLTPTHARLLLLHHPDPATRQAVRAFAAEAGDAELLALAAD